MGAKLLLNEYKFAVVFTVIYYQHVSVVSPTQGAILHQAAESPAAAIEMRKASKNRANFDNCRGQGILFKPLIVETFGGWDAEAVTYLKQLGRHIGAKTTL